MTGIGMADDAGWCGAPEGNPTAKGVRESTSQIRARMPSWTGNSCRSRTEPPGSAPSAGHGTPGSPKYCCMRITFLGHVGFFVETRHGSVLCDPWFTPAYFGSWFPFPRNDGLDQEAFRSPDYLYLSHLHHDHFDETFLASVDKRARVLLPEFQVPYLERELQRLGFTDFVRTRHGETTQLDGLDITIFAMNQPADGPLGDSAIVIADGDACVLNQNDARPGDVAALQALGPFDAHIVQFSGAIWYPVAYDFPPAELDRLAREKRANQMHRARQYIEWIGAHHVFPGAGPPCFRDG